MILIRQVGLGVLAVLSTLVLAACEPSKTVNTPATLVSLAVQPASLTLKKGATQALQVVGSYTDGSTYTLTSTATYASSDATVATVSSGGLVTAAKPGAATITATEPKSGKTATVTVTVPPPALVSIAISPETATLPVGGSRQLAVIGTYEDGSTADLSAQSNFASSNAAAAAIDPAGVVTGVATGTALINAIDTGSGKNASAAITVLPGYAVVNVGANPGAYTLTPFGGANASVVTSGVPTGGPAGAVIKFTKTAGAACYAGTTISTGGQFSIGAIPFSATATTMTVQVYVPVAGVDIKLKAENAANGAISVETDVTPTQTGWQTLTFDFSSPAPGTPALDPTKVYDKLSIFADFTCANNAPAPAADEVFYVGAIYFVGASAPAAPPLPFSYAVVDFNDPALPVTLTPFGGAAAVQTAAGVPAGGPSNQVMQLTKTAGAACYAGVTMSTGYQLSIGQIPFSAQAHTITVQMYVPAAGVDVKLKAEDANNPANTVETDVVPMQTGWQTLTFDFSSPTVGTPALDPAKIYDKLSIFADFTCANGGAAPATNEVFYVGPILFIGAAAPAAPPLSPPVLVPFATVTFDDGGKTYYTSDFAGAASTVGAGPAGSNGSVLSIVKTNGSASYAGTLVGDQGSSGSPRVGAIPFSGSRTTFTVRVWAAAAGLDVKLKVQDASGAHTVETDAVTTVAGGWQTMTFDLSHPATGTPPIDLAQTYNVLVLFPDFGSVPVGADEPAMYFDDIAFP